MAKVKVSAAGIEYIQGALKKPKKSTGHNHGNYLIAIHRVAATENPNCQRLYVKDCDAYTRTTPLSTKEINIRNRFRAVAAMVKERKEDLMKVTQDQAAFLAQKDTAGGKKTMRAYLWMVCGEEYDQENG